MKKKPNTRIYICHTYYHAYVSFLKELALPKEQQGTAHIMLSKMSNNFETLGERILKTGLFSKVYEFDEKREDFFPELLKYKKDHGNIVLNMVSRIIFCKKFSKAQEPFVPVDLKSYEDVYVYCDCDPIGYYLSGHKIYYHSVEDGLDTLKPFVPAVYDNRGALKLKLFMSDKLNLIFIRDGFNKYCLDMEVNDISVISYPCKKYKEVPRRDLFNRLTREDKDILLKAFVDNLDDLKARIQTLDKSKDNILILTDPLCDLATRKRIFTDLYEEYSKEGNVFFKPHPRDELDYEKEFPDVPQFKKTVPMEILNFFDDAHFKKVVGVFTNMGGINFADEKISLGADFMDKYENPEIHRQIEKCKGV